METDVEIARLSGVLEKKYIRATLLINFVLSLHSGNYYKTSNTALITVR